MDNNQKMDVTLDGGYRYINPDGLGVTVAVSRSGERRIVITAYENQFKPVADADGQHGVRAEQVALMTLVIQKPAFEGIQRALTEAMREPERVQEKQSDS